MAVETSFPSSRTIFRLALLRWVALNAEHGQVDQGEGQGDGAQHRRVEEHQDGVEGDGHQLQQRRSELARQEAGHFVVHVQAGDQRACIALLEERNGQAQEVLDEPAGHRERQLGRQAEQGDLLDPGQGGRDDCGQEQATDQGDDDPVAMAVRRGKDIVDQDLEEGRAGPIRER